MIIKCIEMPIMSEKNHESLIIKSIILLMDAIFLLLTNSGSFYFFFRSVTAI